MDFLQDLTNQNVIKFYELLKRAHKPNCIKELKYRGSYLENWGENNKVEAIVLDFFED